MDLHANILTFYICHHVIRFIWKIRKKTIDVHIFIKNVISMY